MLPLFEQYPGLRGAIPHTPLADLPTPVEAAPALAEALGAESAWVKRDDLTAEAYGGNKVRKLEFLLGEAVREKAKTVITFGGAGSNHALATAIYARQLGLKSVSLLSPQPNAHAVRRNLLMSHKVGAELHHYEGLRRAALARLLETGLHTVRDGVAPYVIPPGGSNSMGMLGFVNAGLELQKQVAEGALPAPDIIYVACGTMGTCVGLLLGLRAGGLDTRIKAIQVTNPSFCSLERGKQLYEETSALLAEVTAGFGPFPFPERQLELEPDFFGREYGWHTEEGQAAIRRAEELAGLKLEGVYTGKAFAALLAHGAGGAVRGQHVLFWNTYSSRDLSTEVADVDYHELPKPFHRYFEEEVQALDKAAVERE